MTKEEAIKLAESKFWEKLSLEERAEFQLQEERMCMPFSILHEAVEKSMGRPVFTHEFMDPKSLLEELRGNRPPRTMDDILALIPAEKTVIIIAEK